MEPVASTDMLVVLLADNDVPFLEARAERLAQEGYKVLTACTVQETELLLSEGCVQVAILDVRLENNDNPDDESGLALAKKSDYQLIPKIILTNYPSVEVVRAALGSNEEGVPPAVEFVEKGEGAEALIEVLKKTISLHVHDNPSLVINFSDGELVNFSSLTTLVAPTLSGAELQNHANELHQLFRQLFNSKMEIKIERLLWKDEGRASLLVSTYAPGKAQPQVVVYGDKSLIMKEAEQRRACAPDASGENGTMLVRACETMHFAANAYALAGISMEGNVTLAELYREHPEPTFNSALENLFKKTLLAWQQDIIIADEAWTLEDLHREALGINEQTFPIAEVQQRIRAVIKELPRLRVKIEEDTDKLTVRFGKEVFTYPHPAACIYGSFAAEHPLIANTSGYFSGKNILADMAGRAWVTDFTQAGLKPLLWNYTALEAIIRFDWAETKDIQSLHEMEQILTQYSTNFRPRNVEPPLHKPMRAILHLRQLASKRSHVDWREYQLALFYHAAQRFLTFKPASHLNEKELAKLTHLTLSQAIIANQLNIKTKQLDTGFRLDHVNRAVVIDGQSMRLTPRHYKLLSYLDTHKDRPCSRQELVEKVLEETYDEHSESQQAKLNTSIRRLREAIEENADEPRYLLTLNGVGYRLASGH